MALALLAEVDEGVLQQRGVDGIEAAEGLVHDDEVGLVQQGGDELDLLLHALGELFGLLGDGLGDLHALAPDVGALAGGGGVEAVELAEEDELVDDLHLLVEAALFGQVADALEDACGRRAGRRGSTVPESGTVMPIIMRMEEVLPEPLGPSRPNMLPGSMVKLRSSTAILVS